METPGRPAALPRPLPKSPRARTRKPEIIPYQCAPADRGSIDNLPDPYTALVGLGNLFYSLGQLCMMLGAVLIGTGMVLHRLGAADGGDHESR